ncbi:MAG: hypothetical protein ACRDZO_05875 [Egibacteraceae bacterium]
MRPRLLAIYLNDTAAGLEALEGWLPDRGGFSGPTYRKLGLGVIMSQA